MSTVKQVLALEDRMTPGLTKAEKQAQANIRVYEQLDKELKNIDKALDNLEKTGQSNSKMAKQLNASWDSVRRTMDEYANGVRNAKIESEGLNKSMLPSAVTSLVGWGLVAKGVSTLTQLSDKYTGITARINMMNDGLQTTQELENQIFKSAQNARVDYSNLADIVGKLGNQAKDAFGSSKEIVAFGELLNKSFQTAGQDATSVASTMYNLTQSLSTGQLLGNDYRILKMNAPQMIKYLQDYYNVSRKELDDMVSKGQVSAQAIKDAVFKNADEINKKFNEMPVTFAQAWTKFKNTIEKVLRPVLNVLTKIFEGLDNIFTFLSEHQYIIWTIAIALGAVAGAILIYNTYVTIMAIKTAIASSALLAMGLKMMLIVGIVAIVAGVLLYLWNTNDDVAYGMMFAWDVLEISIRTVAVAIKSIVYGIADVFDFVLAGILIMIQSFASFALAPINGILSGLQAIGVGPGPIDVNFGTKAWKGAITNTENRAKEIDNDWAYIGNRMGELNSTREDRVKNRQKIGYTPSNAETYDYNSMLGSVIGTDSTGDKAIKTTTNDKLLSDEDIQLLLDVATRDYKLNYRQVTPQITMTFGDIRENADVDVIADQLADKLQEIMDGNLEVQMA